jgi:hypothetical protein
MRIVAVAYNFQLLITKLVTEMNGERNYGIKQFSRIAHQSYAPIAEAQCL